MTPTEARELMLACLEKRQEVKGLEFLGVSELKDEDNGMYLFDIEFKSKKMGEKLISTFGVNKTTGEISFCSKEY